eukprot:6193605-Pleurochrysis_carterae.AAC.1
MAPTAFGAQMRAFDAPGGVAMQVPDKVKDSRNQSFRAWCISLHADLPGSSKSSPFYGEHERALPAPRKQLAQNAQGCCSP